MPLCSSLSGYCAAVRTLLRSPTTDAKVPPACAPPPPPPVSWRSFPLAPRASAPSAANHYLLQKAPKCSAPPVPAAFVVSQASPLLHRQVSSLLLHPILVRVRRESHQAHSASLRVNEEKHIVRQQSFERQNFRGEEVHPDQNVPV